MLNWDDLKYLLATVQTGSFSLAAQELGVNRTTVARRIATLEKQLACALLEQAANGYQLTEAGQAVIASARRVEQEVGGLESQLGLDSPELLGSLRVALPLGLGPEFMPELQQFCQRYPALEVELINSVDPMASLNQRKADIGVGVGHSLPDYLQGQHLGELQRAIYASPAYLREHSVSLPLSEQQWVGWGREMAHTQVAKWMQRHISSVSAVSLQVNSWHALRAAVAEGIGVGHLWCFLADGELGLQQIGERIEELAIGLWLFRHRELQHNPRVNAFTEFMAPLLTARIMDK